MTQVKIFSSLNDVRLEKDVNDWLVKMQSNNFELVDIKYQMTLSNAEFDGEYSAMIIYRVF